MCAPISIPLPVRRELRRCHHEVGRQSYPDDVRYLLRAGLPCAAVKILECPNDLRDCSAPGVRARELKCAKACIAQIQFVGRTSNSFDDRVVEHPTVTEKA